MLLGEGERLAVPPSSPSVPRRPPFLTCALGAHLPHWSPGVLWDFHFSGDAQTNRPLLDCSSALLSPGPLFHGDRRFYSPPK